MTRPHGVTRLRVPIAKLFGSFVAGFFFSACACCLPGVHGPAMLLLAGDAGAEFAPAQPDESPALAAWPAHGGSAEVLAARVELDR